MHVNDAADEIIRILDHGFVRLDDAMADDLSVANAARVSFARRKTELDESDEGLIRFLMRDRHGTPFEHNSFRFHVQCPIFVAREWFRHRISSFNEFSMRYAKATDEFYVPSPGDVRSQVGKPGAYTFEPVGVELAEQARDEIQAVYDHAFDTAPTSFVWVLAVKGLLVGLLAAGAYVHDYVLGPGLARQIRAGRPQSLRPLLTQIGRANLAITIALPVLGVVLSELA